jgi:hypothetical protein
MSIQRHAFAFSVVASLAALLIGCAEPSPGIRIEDPAEMRTKLRPVFGEPIFIPSSGRVAFPFAAESESTEKESWGISSGSFVLIGSAAFGIGSYAGETGSDSLRWNNLAFYDPSTGKSWLLFNDPVLICQFYLPNKERGPVFGDYLLYGVAREDNNRDGTINADDAVVLMASDPDGNPPRLLSPAGEQLVDVIGSKDDPDWVYFRARRDSDGDRKFTDKDRIDAFRIRPGEVLKSGKDAEPQRVLPDTIRNEAFDVVLKAARPAAAR